MKVNLWSAIIVLSIFVGIEISNAFEVEVHKKISKSAIDASTNINSSISDIGLKNGILEELKGVKIRDWIEEGSKQEDEPIYGIRYFKHFYEPISGSGLYGMLLSSYQWASDGGNEWSWSVARSKYYDGLTKTTDTGRRAALADSFRSIGQVMHLVEDLASVAHTRNDGHLIYDGFEAYTKKKINNLNYSAYGFANALTSVSSNAPKQFWDSDTYTGSNPSNNDTQGLSEYTNANFAREWLC